MAPQADISQRLGHVKPVLKSSQSIDTTNEARFADLASVEAYLLTQGYTQATLDKMNKNDKYYAARLKVGAAVSPMP